MFSIHETREDTIIEGAVNVPIKSYNNYVTLVSTLKQDESYPINVDGVPCILKPYDGGDGHIILDIDLPHLIDGKNLFITFIVADKKVNEALVLLENKKVVNSFGLPVILRALNDFLAKLEL